MATLSFPFIFVKEIGKRQKASTKIPLGSSIEEISKSIQKVLKSKKPVSQLFDSNGNPIHTKEDIIPNSLIFYSFNPNQKTPRKQVKGAPIVTSSPNKYVPPKKSFVIYNKNQAPKAKLMKATKKENELLSIQKTTEFTSPKKSKYASKIPQRKPRKFIPDDPTDSEAETRSICESRKPIYKYNIDQLSEPRSPKKLPIVDDTSYSEDDLLVSEPPELNYVGQSEIGEQSTDRLFVSEISQVSQPEESQRKLFNNQTAQRTLKKSSMEFFDKVEELEDAQKRHLCDSFLSFIETSGFKVKFASMIHQVELQKFITAFIEENKSNQNYIFQTLLMSAPQSGSSCFLGLLSRHLYVDMVLSDLHRRYFLLPLDLKKFNFSESYESSLKAIVKHLITCLEAQLPLLSRVSVQLKKSLEKGTQFTTREEFCTDYVKDINQIIKELSNASEDDRYERLFMLFVDLPKALGFDKTIFVVDHYNSQSDESILRCLHLAVSRCPYIISSKTTPTGAFQSSNTLLLADIVSTPQYPDSVINIEMNEGQKVQIGVTACGGIPAYLKVWYDINKLFDRSDKLSPDTDEYEETYTTILSLTDDFVRMVLTGDSLGVADVWRKENED